MSGTIKKICKRCNKEFATQNIRPWTVKYCSQECRLEPQLVVCANCMKQIYKPKSKISISKNHFCNSKCYHQYHRLDKCPSWKGGTTLGTGNYIYITNNEVCHYPEHRYVMEKHLKRKLLSTEIVHHINFKKDDNRIENLLLTNSKEHWALHNTKRIKAKEWKLKDWIKEKGWSKVEFARRLGVSRVTVFLWLSEKNVPSKYSAMRIEKLTGGKIKANGWQANND